MRMRSERIVETVDILKNAQFEFIKGRVSSEVGFFFFQVFEKALHYSIIIRMPFAEND